MELDIHGLKCDHCTWEDMSVKYEDYPNRINDTCPECGEVILTQEQYDQCEQIRMAVEMASKYTPEQQQALIDSLSPEEMDAALDKMNDLGARKVSDNDDGTETWTLDKVGE